MGQLYSSDNTIQKRLGEHVDFSLNITRDHILKQIIASKKAEVILTSSSFFPNIVVQANMKFLYDIFYRKVYHERLSSQVFISTLNTNLFTNPKQENLLLYYHEDLNYIKQQTNIALINENLNKAAQLLNERGIRLIFMPCVDKFDLYYPYIKNKSGIPENTLFEDLRKVSNKNYIFIDTKKILREALERGEKDIYWLNDTHWSWRGMSIVCEKIFEEINQDKK